MPTVKTTVQLIALNLVAEVAGKCLDTGNNGTDVVPLLRHCSQTR